MYLPATWCHLKVHQAAGRLESLAALVLHLAGALPQTPVTQAQTPAMNKFGPKPLPSDQLRLASVRVHFSPLELAELDSRRGHYSRPDFLRATGLGTQLKSAPLPLAVRTWSDSARIQSCLTQINEHSTVLNSIRLEAGQEQAALELLNRATEVLKEFKAFRLILSELTGMNEPKDE